MENVFSFEMNEEVQDRYSDFKGIVVARAQYAYTGPQYGVMPKNMDHHGRPPEIQWFNEGRLIPV